MEAVRIDDPGAWLDAAGPLLAEDEARHNLLFGVAGTLARQPARYPSWHLWTVRAGDEVVGASLHTPPFNVIVARPRTSEALPVLVQAIAGAGVRPPGVTAADPEAAAFAAAWVERMGGTWRTVMAQGIYRLTSVSEVPPAPGGARIAGDGDRDLLLAWVRAFSEESLGHRPLAEPQVTASVDQRLEGRGEGFVVWEDGGIPVSMCGFGGPTPNGIRIGPVYTPAEHRGRGYATSVVAQVSAAQLVQGRRFCFLFTDLANPTSNAIYRRIGYTKVCGSREIAFDG